MAAPSKAHLESPALEEAQRCGGSARECSSGSAGERDFLRYQERLTRKLIERYWTDIAQVARALVERDLLIGAEVSEIIAPTGRLLASEHHAERARWEEAMQDEEDQSDRDQCPPTESTTGHEAG